MKKTLMCSIFLILIIITGCSNTNKNNEKEINIVTTIFPIYDWIKEITDEDNDVDVEMLVDSGIDLHSFQPSIEDISNINEADLKKYLDIR